MLGQRTHSPSAQLLALAVLVGRLDDLDPGIRSFAAQLLLGECAVYTSDQIFGCPAAIGSAGFVMYAVGKGAAGRHCGADNSHVLHNMYSLRMHGKYLPCTITVSQQRGNSMVTAR